jgi:Mg/Co/Ni transporter MgtE
MTREGVLAEMREVMQKKHKIYRDASSGHLVTKEYAEANPDTTVSEVIRTGTDEGSDNKEDEQSSGDEVLKQG